VTGLSIALLSVAIQAASPNAAAQATPPEAGDVQQQSPKDETKVQKTSSSERTDSDCGLADEIEKLVQLQNEIRALLHASEVCEEPQRTTDEGGEAGSREPDGEGPSPETAVAVDALAAADALYLCGRYREAFDLYSKATIDGPEDSCWTTFQEANCLRWLGRSEEAVGLYQKIVSQFPESFWAFEAEWWIGEIQWKMDYRGD
jgi:tetratricopeptide (TPR) repeat protein